MFDHEGDWEMIQVHLDSVGTPTGATYAQHNTGEYCTWNNVELSPTGRPVVYVAHESHASYFWGGDHRVVVDNLPDQWDYADGAGESLVPDVIQLDPLVPPLWMQWPGKWGGADSSPKAPPHQDKWADPLAFQADASACTSAPPSLRRRADTEVLRPAAPLVKARRVGTVSLLTIVSRGRLEPLNRGFWLRRWMASRTDTRPDQCTNRGGGPHDRPCRPADSARPWTASDHR